MLPFSRDFETFLSVPGPGRRFPTPGEVFRINKRRMCVCWRVRACVRVSFNLIDIARRTKSELMRTRQTRRLLCRISGAHTRAAREGNDRKDVASVIRYDFWGRGAWARLRRPEGAGRPNRGRGIGFSHGRAAVNKNARAQRTAVLPVYLRFPSRPSAACP